MGAGLLFCPSETSIIRKHIDNNAQVLLNIEIPTPVLDMEAKLITNSAVGIPHFFHNIAHFSQLLLLLSYF